MNISFLSKYLDTPPFNNKIHTLICLVLLSSRLVGIIDIEGIVKHGGWSVILELGDFTSEIGFCLLISFVCPLLVRL